MCMLNQLLEELAEVLARPNGDTIMNNSAGSLQLVNCTLVGDDAAEVAGGLLDESGGLMAAQNTTQMQVTSRCFLLSE